MPQRDGVSIELETEDEAENLTLEGELLAYHRQQQVFPVLGAVSLGETQIDTTALSAGFVFPEWLDSVSEDVEHSSHGHDCRSAEMSLDGPEALQRVEGGNDLVLLGVVVGVGLALLLLDERPDLILAVEGSCGVE